MHIRPGCFIRIVAILTNLITVVLLQCVRYVECACMCVFFFCEIQIISTNLPLNFLRPRKKRKLLQEDSKLKMVQ